MNVTPVLPGPESCSTFSTSASVALGFSSRMDANAVAKVEIPHIKLCGKNKNHFKKNIAEDRETLWFCFTSHVYQYSP